MIWKGYDEMRSNMEYCPNLLVSIVIPTELPNDFITFPKDYPVDFINITSELIPDLERLWWDVQ